MAIRVKKNKPDVMSTEQINRASEIVTSLFKKHDAANNEYDRKRLCKTLVGQLLLNTNSDKEFHSILKNAISDYLETSVNKGHYNYSMELHLDPQIITLFSMLGGYRSKSETKTLGVNGGWAYSHKISKGKVVIAQRAGSVSSYNIIRAELTLYSTQSMYLNTPQWS